jgi:hypothetical protein
LKKKPRKLVTPLVREKKHVLFDFSQKKEKKNIVENNIFSVYTMKQNHPKERIKRNTKTTTKHMMIIGGRREMEKKVGGILISNFTLDKKKIIIQ